MATLLSVPVASFTSRGVYHVDLARRSCTCPSFAFRSMPCKHMVYVQRMASGLTEIPPSARMSPDHVVPMPSSTSEAWYAVDYVNRTCTCVGFQHRRQCKHVEDALELETMFQNETIQIPSYSTDGVWYTVDLDSRTCTCPSFVHRHEECKHIEDALELKRMFTEPAEEDSDSTEDSEYDSAEDSEYDSAEDSEPEYDSAEDSEPEYDSAEDSDFNEEDSVMGGIQEETDSDSEPEVTSSYRPRNVRRRLFEESDSDSAGSCASDATWYPSS